MKIYMLDCPGDFTWKEGAYTHFALEGFNTGDKPNRNLIRHMSIMTPYLMKSQSVFQLEL